MRRPVKSRAVLSAAVAFPLVVGFLWFVCSHGGPVTALRIPPTRDYSTPASQNGFTLLAVQGPEDNRGNFHFTPPPAGPSQWPTEERYASGEDHPVAGLWLRLPDGGANPSTFLVSGHASSGQDFPLTASYPSGGGRGDILFTSLPGCYAGSLPYVDVAVSDGQRHTARWRINRLPTMKHVITEPVRVAETFNAAGVKLTLRATRRQGKRGEYVLCQVFPSIAPGSHQWEFRWRGDAPETDWMPFDAEQAETTSMILTDTAVKKLMVRNHGAALYEFIEHPYVGEDRYVRIQSHLTQFETYDEQVTFHNVQVDREDPGAIFRVFQRQSVTTPSGIHVTLPVQNKVDMKRQGGFDKPDLTVEVQPSSQENQLPRSPLEREYSNPVAISIQAVKPFGFLGETTEPTTTRTVMLFVPATEFPNPSKPHDLSLIVRQRVDLQTLPVTLTAPITDGTATQAP